MPAAGKPDQSTDAVAVIEAYRRYWHDALMRGSDAASLEAAAAALLVDLRRVLGEDDDADWDRIDQRVKAAFDRLGWHVLRGITPPLRELMVWKDERVLEEQAALPDGHEAVRVVFMQGFKSRGWADYATCGRSSSGGWTASDRLYAVAGSYDTRSEHYRVSYLGHEGQHFRDKRQFVGDRALAPWRLEYRAKLVELALADKRQAELLGVFASDVSADPSFPHSHANQRVIEALERALPAHRPWREAATWSTAESDALRSAARMLLADDDRALSDSNDRR